MSEERFGGSCLCGAVRYSVTGPFSGFYYCHCSRCRKVSGSAHAANLFAPLAGLRWESGEEEVRTFDHPDARFFRRSFCASCGSAVPWVSRSGRGVVVPAGGLDDDPGERPSRNIYFASRAAWYEHASELEIHDELP